MPIRDFHTVQTMLAKALERVCSSPPTPFALSVLATLRYQLENGIQRHICENAPEILSSALRGSLGKMTLDPIEMDWKPFVEQQSRTFLPGAPSMPAYRRLPTPYHPTTENLNDHEYAEIQTLLAGLAQSLSRPGVTVTPEWRFAYARQLPSLSLRVVLDPVRAHDPLFDRLRALMASHEEEPGEGGHIVRRIEEAINGQIGATIDALKLELANAVGPAEVARHAETIKIAFQDPEVASYFVTRGDFQPYDSSALASIASQLFTARQRMKDAGMQKCELRVSRRPCAPFGGRVDYLTVHCSGEFSPSAT